NDLRHATLNVQTAKTRLYRVLCDFFREISGFFPLALTCWLQFRASFHRWRARNRHLRRRGGSLLARSRCCPDSPERREDFPLFRAVSRTLVSGRSTVVR